jgi:hypothetical protein
MSRIVNRAWPIGHPEIAFTSRDPQLLLERERNKFPEVADKNIKVWMLRQPTLACVQHCGNAISIRIHSVLNHPQTPEEVFVYILLHELLHLRIMPRNVDGKMRSHPPEFSEAERTLIPERSLCWGWITLILNSCIRRDIEQEATFIKSNWRLLMNGDRPSLLWVKERCGLRSIHDPNEEEPCL